MSPTPIGITEITREVLEILPDARRKRMAIFGKSGVGKTTLLRNMIVSDIRAGAGVTVIDPHGGLIDELLELIPRSRTNDVVYFNPRDPERVPAINVLEHVTEDRRPLVVSALISTLRNIWPDNWGPRTEYILAHAAFALLAQPQPVTLLAIPKLLTERDYRDRVRRCVTNPALVSFFDLYDNHWPQRLREETVAPLLNKVTKFITNPLLRAIIGQPRSSFDFRELLDTKKILLCDLSKGALGEDVSSLLGSLIVTKLSLAALSRQDGAAGAGHQHYLYADEVQSFIHGVDFPTILSEARKYRLTLVIATQTLAQLPPACLSAVFGNCATVVSFRVSGEDAKVLREEFSTMVAASQLQDLPDYKSYVRTLMGGRPTGPHLVNTLPPAEETGE
jgi:type IV secretory pathway TraG/TraD family ATPase VirD4